MPVTDPLELAVQKRVMAWFDSLPGAKAIKITVDGYVPTGTPDVLACVNGQMFAIELKRSESEKPEPRQVYELMRWKRSGAIVGVCWT